MTAERPVFIIIEYLLKYNLKDLRTETGNSKTAAARIRICPVGKG